MTKTSNHDFVWFEFDGEVAALWQSIAVPSIKTFAYQQKLRSIIQQSQLPWQTSLESLKVLDVFLSAVKSDLANQHIKEVQALSHDEFIKMLAVLVFHVVQVLQSEIVKVVHDGKIELYSAQGFNRLYARAFAGLVAEPLQDMADLDGFYQGLAVVGVGNNQTRTQVAQGLFVLVVIGARLFGSMERIIVGLGQDAKVKNISGEDSLYWAVVDFLNALKTATNHHARDLFLPKAVIQPITQVATDSQDVSQVVAPETASIFSQLEQDYLTDPIKPVINQLPKNTLDDTTTTQNTKSTQTKQSYQTPSVYKQKARASHTPKLFVEAYQDLLNMPMPSDTQQLYQQAVGVLNQFDNHINDELAKGKSLAQISFSGPQKQLRKNALQNLVTLVKQHNHTSAMLHLALYCFEGRGMAQNTKKAIMLTEQAAKMGDARAQKLLSRLYYQGFDVDNGGITSNQELADMWLKKAADNGHSEAQKLVAYMNQIQILKEDYRSEQRSDKRYGMFFLALIIGALLLVFVMNLIW